MNTLSDIKMFFNKEHYRYLGLLAVIIFGIVSILGSGGGGGDSTAPPPTTPPLPVSPQVIDWFPTDQEDPLVTTLVTAQFDRDMDKASVENNFSLVDNSHTPISGTTTYSSGEHILEFIPDNDLLSGMIYTATLTTAVIDKSGEPLANDFVWSFTVAPTLTLVSSTAAGVTGTAYDGAENSDIDETGEFIVFVSKENLASQATGGYAQIYRKNTVTGKVEIVSRVNNTIANGDCSSPSISDTGRFVVFASTASNLDTTVTNPGGYNHIYRKDMRDGDLDLLDVKHDDTSVAGNENSDRPDISATGNFIAFQSAASNLIDNDTNGHTDIFILNYSSGLLERVSIATSGDEAKNGSSYNPSISGDGKHIVFESDASDLVAGDSGGHRDILIRDRNGSTTTLISVDSNEVQADADSLNAEISVDGNHVVFQSVASNLVSGDTNSKTDVFLRDMVNTTTTRMSVKSDGNETTSGDSTSPSINADGSYVAFSSTANDLVSSDPNGTIIDVFVRDTQTANSIQLLSLPTPPNNQASGYDAAFSSNGRYISFTSPYSFDAQDGNGTNDDIYRAHNAALP
jgi:hypothetical protein